jgi:hypothetical protein
MANDITKIPAPRTPLVDETSGDMSPAWYRFFYNVFVTLGEGSGILPTNKGGTGQTSYTNGQLLIGNSVGNTLSKNTLTPGTGIGVTNGNGTIAVANTGVLSNIAGAGISVSSTTGNVTIGNTGVLSVSGGSTGLTPSTATTGAVVLAGTLDVDNGGTGQTSFTNGQLLIGNTTGNTLDKATLTAGTGISITNGAGAITITNSSPSLGGDVVGPASATDNAIARFDTTTGKLIQNSVVTVSDTGAVTGFTTASASTSVTTPIVQASNSGGLALKNSGGTTQMSVGAGGGDNMSINVSTNLNGTNAQIDISPTGTGHVHIKPSGTGAVEIAPTNAGTMNNMVIGGATPLAITGTTITATTFNGSGSGLTNVVNSLAASTGISVSASTGAVTVTNTAPDQTVALTAGTGISTSGTYPNFTITNTAPSSGGTVTSVAALTLGTTGTDLSSTVANGTTTPVITLQVPTASAANRGALSAADWTTFNSKAPGVTFTTNYIPYGQGTTTLNQSSALQYSAGAFAVNTTVAGSVEGVFTNTNAGVSASAGVRAIANSTGYFALRQYGTGVTATAFGLTIANYTLLFTDGASSNGLIIGCLTADPIIFGTNNTEKMRIFSSGGVSIGNTTDAGAGNLSVTGTIRTQGYTVATLPAAGTVGRKAYVTDALAPTFLAVIVGGGAVRCPVFDNGTAWVAG